MTDTTTVALDAEQAALDAAREAVQATKEKILSIFDTWPFISRSMLQVAIGPANPPSIWGPVLDQLVAEEVLCIDSVQVTTPKGDVRTRAVIHRKNVPYDATAYSNPDPLA